MVKSLFLAYNITIMEYLNNLIEYYDELYQASDAQKKFYTNLIQQFGMPTKILGIGCSTGNFEYYLAQLGHDVTGIDTSPEMLESASRRRRMPNTAIRFFEMSTVEMSRFLGKDFYNIISCLNNKIIFIHDKILLKKFFVDCKSLLTEQGILILQFGNYSHFAKNGKFSLPSHKSIRVNLVTKIEQKSKDEFLLSQKLDRGDDRYLPVLKETPILPVTPELITSFAKEAGFTSINFTNGWSQEPFTEDNNNIVCVLK